MGQTSINVKIIFEGKKKLAASRLPNTYVAEDKRKRTALMCVIPSYLPQLRLSVGLRGLVYRSQAVGAKTDLHSGMQRGCTESSICSGRNHQQTEGFQRKGANPGLLQERQGTKQR
jgi:hypothetical protein